VPTQTSVYLLDTICAFCPPRSDPGDLTIAPSGNYLFYGSSTFGVGLSEGIGVLAVDSAAGTLTSVSGSPFPADQVPVRLSVNPSGQYVYTENVDAAGTGGFTLQSISGFSVDATTGALASVAGSPFATPVSATVGGLAMHPSGNFLYVASGTAANGILAWSIEATNGALTPLTGSPYQTGLETYGAALDPSGKFLYTSAGLAGGILGFRVDATSGALTLVTGSPFSPEFVLSAPSMDPSGKFLFTADGQSSVIRGFSIDSQTGVLTPLGTSTPLAVRPISMTIVKAP
jgi:6-phosphogluconolactonase (cycloisomerase 2 family)